MRDKITRAEMAELLGVTVETLRPDDLADCSDVEVEAAVEVEDETSRELDQAARDRKAEFDAMLGGYVACLDPVMFVRRADKKRLSTVAFDWRHNPAVNVIPKLADRYKDHAAKLALAQDTLQRTERVCYRPGEPDVCDDGAFNMWIDPKIEPLNEKPEIFIAHMKYLIPDEAERKLVLDYLAWMVQRPTLKIMFALLIVGEGGTGKSWLGYMLQVLFGDQNVAMVESEDAVTDTFNGWTVYKRLGFVHEIAPGGKVDLVARCKGVITERHIWVNEKYIARHRVDNCTNLIAISNHRDALKISRKDRRWCAVLANDDVFGTDDNGDPTSKTISYYEKLFACIGTPESPGAEVRRILHWLGKRDLSGFKGQSLAPLTDAKEEIADAQLSDLAAAVLADFRERRGAFAYSLTTPAEVLDQTSHSLSSERDRNLSTVAKVMTECGCRRVGKQLRLRGIQARLWTTSKAGAAQYANKPTPELAAVYEAERDDPSI
jgi:hypothetical protein